MEEESVAESVRTITSEQLEDPLAFDASKVLVFKMPQVTSKQMYNKVDRDDPSVTFKNSKYYREKHHLGGFMDRKGLKDLNKKIHDMGDHRQDIYTLSPDRKTQKKQIGEMIEKMNDSIEASRLEMLLMYDEKAKPRMDHTFS